jgi:coenzyme F420-dependent glucose-6-phosphate dehydrogenase
MAEIGYKLSSEEHPPRDLVKNAARAEEAGFSFAVASDHYHPWIDRQGHSPFVWSVLGGIAEATRQLKVGTAVTCPTIRIHPAIIAQAAATTAAMMPGRFFLGVGSGQNLNEPGRGDRWPPVEQRLAMLEEAVEVMRKLWGGSLTTHRGDHYTVENARLYSLPERRPDVMVAAAGEKATRLAARIGDGFIGIAPDPDIVTTYREAGGNGPLYGEVHVCWAAVESEARKTAHEWWPNIALKGQLGQELALPSHFRQAAEMVSQEDVAEMVPCGPDPERHIEMISKFTDAGFDHVFVHQIGPDQEGFFSFYEESVLPKLG